MAVPSHRLDLDSDADLAAAAAEGDTLALARLVRLHHEAMTRAALAVTLDRTAAAAAVLETWPTVRRDIARHAADADLGAWLAGLAIMEALGAPAVPPHPDPALADDPELAVRLAGVRPADRARLALVLLARGDPATIRDSYRPGAARRAEERLDRLVALIAGTGARGPATATGPDTAAGRAAQRLVAFVDVPVRAVDADAIARRAAAELRAERGRRIAVAISAVVGLAVATAPYLLPVLLRR